jgi:hypothetical protein
VAVLRKHKAAVIAAKLWFNEYKNISFSGRTPRLGKHKAAISAVLSFK